MKKPFLFIVLLLAIATASIAQDYEVRSIEYLPGDVFANINVRTERPNGGKKCAVLRIVTQNISPEDRKEFKFTPDMGSFIGDKETTDSEILLWVSPEITYLTIESKLGRLEIYFPDYLQGEVESLKTYRILIVGTKEQPIIVEQKGHKGYGSCKVVFMPSPKDAIVYLNGDSIGSGINTVSTHPGINHWSIEHPLYHNENGTIELSKGKADTVDIALTPAYGYLKIEDDYGLDDETDLFLNGVNVGKAPYESEKLASGMYSVAFAKGDETLATGQVMIKDNQVSIESVNNLFSLYYYKRNHNYSSDMEMIADSLSRLARTQFVPITGKITINSTPSSIVSIDGYNYGNTPITIDTLAVGTHDLVLKSSGCTPLQKTVSVKEGEETIYNLQLPRACILTIVSDEDNDIVHIDNEYAGRTPVTVELPFGAHSITLNRVGKFQQTKEINLNPEEPELTLQLTFGQHVDIEAGNNSHRLYVDGVYVGRTPTNPYLSLGTHTLRAERGWKAGSKTVNVEEGKDLESLKIPTFYEKPAALLSHGAFFMTGNVAMIKSGQPVYGFNIGDIANGGMAGWFFSFITNRAFIDQFSSGDYSLFNAWKTADETGHVTNGPQETYSGEKSILRGSALFGVALKVAGPVYLRIGAGAGIRHMGWKTQETKQWVVINPYSWKGFEASLGMQCCLYNFVLNTDVLISEDVLIESKKLFEFRAGFGYFLQHKRSKR